METTNQTSAIDKMRSIVNWANYQSEGVNQNIRSINDLVKVYDFCDKKGIEFADTLQTEEPRLYEQITNKLGYKFFKTMITTIKTIDINAKQWFDKINGNSYFSAIVTINYGMEGEGTIKVPFEYGYGDYYRFAAYKAITEQYPELKDIPMGYLSEHGIILRSHIQKNCLKREVKEWGQNTNK